MDGNILIFFVVARLDLQHQGHIPAAFSHFPGSLRPVDMAVKGQHMHILIADIFVVADVGGYQPVTPQRQVSHTGGEGILVGGIQAKAGLGIALHKIGHILKKAMVTPFSFA